MKSTASHRPLVRGLLSLWVVASSVLAPSDWGRTAPNAQSRAALLQDIGLESIASRVASRRFPSVFEAWKSAQRLNQGPKGPVAPLVTLEPPLASSARHDLYFGNWSDLGLRIAGRQHYPVLTPEFTTSSIQDALRNRRALLKANPSMIILAEVRYYSAGLAYLPTNSPWWRRDSRGYLRSDDPKVNSFHLDFDSPEFQNATAALCAALVRSQVYDGCLLDWWRDDDDAAARLSLIKKIRAAIGEQAILMGNVHGRLPERTAPYLNGMYMEGFGGRFFPDWRTAAANLIWARSHLRHPAITALEGWWATGRDQFPLMREVTTLSLVFSDGYVLFSDPNSLPTPDHQHDWYPFWDKTLGRAVGPVAALNRPDLSGAYSRQFEHGEAVFNPPSNAGVVVRFRRPRRSAATGALGTAFTVAPGDGDLFLASTATPIP